MKKDGANKGRQFFKCPKQPNPCNFFQWADETSPPNSFSSAGTTNNSFGGNNTDQTRSMYH